MCNSTYKPRSNCRYNSCLLEGGFSFYRLGCCRKPRFLLTATVSNAGETLLYTGNALGTTFVRRHNTIWQCIVSHTANAEKVPPSTRTGSIYWKQAELCGKTLQSCKCRFQAIPTSNSADNQAPSGEKNTNIILPFGAFPGASKY